MAVNFSPFNTRHICYIYKQNFETSAISDYPAATQYTPVYKNEELTVQKTIVYLVEHYERSVSGNLAERERNGERANRPLTSHNPLKPNN